MTLTVERCFTEERFLIGRKGDMMKKIGTQARKELEEILSTRIYLGFSRQFPRTLTNSPR